MALPGGTNTGEYPYPSSSPSTVEEQINALYDYLEKKRGDFYTSSSPITTSSKTIENDDNDDDILTNFEEFETLFEQTTLRISSRFKKIEASLSSITTNKATAR